jgi:two-component system chemotaxis response regulator CheY
VLIVDDSLVMRMIVERALRHAGLALDEVLQAANGLEALAILEQAAVSGKGLDLIVSDVHMPVMDGIAFLLEKQRRSLAETVPVIMMTADGDDPQTAAAVAAGAYSFISKPFTMEQMQIRLARLLRTAA